MAWRKFRKSNRREREQPRRRSRPGDEGKPAGFPSYVFQPGHFPARDRQLNHLGVGRRPMPVLLARRCDGRVAGSQLMRLVTPRPHTRAALDYMKDLSARMCVPHRVCARFEMNEADLRPRVRLVHRVLQCAAAKPTAGGRLGARRYSLRRSDQLHLAHPTEKEEGQRKLPLD
jgi:hypothetical protein